jgi:hypothetical protein
VSGYLMSEHGPDHRKYALCSDSAYLEGGPTFLEWMCYCCELAVKGLLRFV